MNIVFINDDTAANLEPITLTREPQDIFCAGTTLRRVFTEAALQLPGTLYVQSRLVPSYKAASSLWEMLDGTETVFFHDGEAIAVYRTSESTHETLASAASNVARQSLIDWQSFEQPWHIVEQNVSLLSENLDFIKKRFRKAKKNVYVGYGVSIGENVVFDTTEGAIVIDDYTAVSDMAVLRGPIYVGKHTVVKSFSEIYGNCSIGDHCKVGGEVMQTVMSDYSNQQHYGFIGASYIGSWVNLAAGTTNSNLKNNYGTVKMNGLDTGMQFLGAVFGDHAKTAIGAMIFTGKVIGVGSGVYGNLTSDLPSFTNGGTLLQQWVENDFDALLETQAYMMARRMQTMTEEHRAQLQTAYERTAEERAGRGIAKGPMKFYE